MRSRTWMVICSIYLTQISPVLFVRKLQLSFVGSRFVFLAALIRSFSVCGVLPFHHLSVLLGICWVIGVCGFESLIDSEEFPAITSSNTVCPILSLLNVCTTFHITLYLSYFNSTLRTVLWTVLSCLEFMNSLMLQ